MTFRGPRLAAFITAAVAAAAGAAYLTHEGARGAASASGPGMRAGASMAAPLPQSARPLGITLVAAQTALIVPTINLPGTVSVLPSQTAVVSPRVQGQVAKVLVQVGDTVRTGQTLAILRSLDVESAQSAYRQTKTQVRYAALALAHQRSLAHLGSFTQKPLEDARTAITTARAALMSDQSSLQQDLLTVQQDQSTVLQDQSAQRQDEMDQAHDRQAAEREQKLYQEGIHALQDLESAQNVAHKDDEKVRGDREKIAGDQLKVQADQAKVAGDQTRIKTDENQVRINDEALHREMSAFSTNVYAAQAVEQAESAYHAALEQLQQAADTLRIHGVSARSAAGLVEIKAPISGTITARNVNPGVNVDTSTQTPWQMFTISNIDTVDVDAGVFDRDLREVELGMPMTAASPADPHTIYAGRVSYIAPSVDPASHTVKVRCQVVNPRSRLKDGMYVDVTLRPGNASHAVVVPTAAVQKDESGSFVFVPKPGGGFTRRPVVVGRDTGDKTEVISGLAVGQQVVSGGALFLASNAPSGDD